MRKIKSLSLLRALYNKTNKLNRMPWVLVLELFKKEIEIAYCAKTNDLFFQAKK